LGLPQGRGHTLKKIVGKIKKNFGVCPLFF